MELIDWLILGSALGIVANFFGPRTSKGFLGPIILGITGYLVGVWLIQVFISTTGKTWVGQYLSVITFLIAGGLLTISRLMKNDPKIKLRGRIY